MKTRSIGITAIAAATVLILSFQNCSGGFEGMNFKAKQDFLGKNPVFSWSARELAVVGGSLSGSNAGAGGAVGANPGMGGGGVVPGLDMVSGGGTSTPIGMSPNVVTTGTSIALLCSDRATGVIGSNATSAQTLKLAFISASQTIDCELNDPLIKEKIINNNVLYIPNPSGLCPNLKSGEYSLAVSDSTQDPRQKSILRISTNFSTAGYGKLSLPRATVVVASSQSIKVTVHRSIPNRDSRGDLDKVEKGRGTPDFLLLYNKNKTTAQAKEDESCDMRASPLIVRMDNKSGIQLTSPLDGVLFDIWGSQSFPVPYEKKQISWIPRELATGELFVVLPNSNGEVAGVDQLFGDNTMGPDGKLAANGYEALRKYDGRRGDGAYDMGRRDGVINRADEIFSQLRFWADLNGDGVAQLPELATAYDLGITLIDLNYDQRFLETDAYGNQTKMKSVVKTVDGKLHLIYDLWFRPL